MPGCSHNGTRVSRSLTITRHKERDDAFPFGTVEEFCDMATVVQLSDYRRENRQSEPRQGGATIHLFLGVRYERFEEERPRDPVRRGGGKKSRKRA